MSVTALSPVLKRLSSQLPLASRPLSSPVLRQDSSSDSTLFVSPSLKRPRRDENSFPRPSHFPTNNPQPNDLDALLPRGHRPTINENGARFYSEEDVRHILNNALSQFEQQLRTQYDAILVDKLQDQYNCFVTFNTEYLSKTVNNNEMSYYM
ncbi:hypothetical protein RCL1_000090 [Eukaryota sp. TZLM3-RCL]